MEDWAVGDKVTILMCLHRLHLDCAVEWASKQRGTKRCPYCKEPMFPQHRHPVGQHVVELTDCGEGEAEATTPSPRQPMDAG